MHISEKRQTVNKSDLIRTFQLFRLQESIMFDCNLIYKKTTTIFEK